MKFKSKEDLDLPIEAVFEMLADFERHERSGLRRGIEITRVDALGEAGLGAKWDIVAKFRGKKREIGLEVTEFDKPNEIELQMHMHGLDSVVLLTLVALSKTRTRLSVEANLKPRTLSARLLLQSVKLARAKVMSRFDERLAAIARDMEDRAAKVA